MVARSAWLSVATLALLHPAPAAESLFDGKTFAGWNGDTATVWRIEDGAIVVGDPRTPAPQNEFLATNRRFGDFELRLEYRLDCGADCNAGVQFRTARVPGLCKLPRLPERAQELAKPLRGCAVCRSGQPGNGRRGTGSQLLNFLDSKRK